MNTYRASRGSQAFGSVQGQEQPYRSKAAELLCAYNKFFTTVQHNVYAAESHAPSFVHWATHSIKRSLQGIDHTKEVSS